MKKLLIVVDMQHDFIDGALANKDAQSILSNVAKEIKSATQVIFTRDTHTENYLNTQEGKFLPIVHCIQNTHGWEVDESLIKACKDNNVQFTYLNKSTFGYNGWKSYFSDEYAEESVSKYDEIEFCGTCTNICVVSNALALKAVLPEMKITCKADACAGFTKEKHNAALEVMRSCQVIVNE